MQPMTAPRQTPRESFVEAAQYLVDYLVLDGDPRATKRLRALCEAFADAVCETADYPDCWDRASNRPEFDSDLDSKWTLRAEEHAACRAALLREIGV